MSTAPDDVESSLQRLRRELDRTATTPIYQQIVREVADRIEQGDWPSGLPLPTIKQLTHRLDVSEMTVRRALKILSDTGLIESRRGSGTVVAGGARRAGLEVAALPVDSSRKLRVGVVQASLHDGYPFLQPMLKALETGTGAEDDDTSVRLHLLHLSPRESDPNVIRHQLPLDELDGLMLMSPINAALLWLCQRRALPYVLLFNDVADAVSTCVLCDYLPGMHEAMGAVHAAGCRRPALVTAGPVRFSTGPISDAFRHAARLHGLMVGDGDTVAADYTQQHGYDTTLRLLKQDDRPDAIFYSSDFQACGGLLAASELGLRVPDDVSIVGAGAVVTSMQWPQRLSTIDLGLAEMSRLALAAIRQQLENPPPHPRRLIVSSRFLAGQTTLTV